MIESSFVVEHMELLPGPDRNTTALAVWRAARTGWAAAAARGARRRRGKAKGRGRGRKGARIRWLLFGYDGACTLRQPLAKVPPDPKEYQGVEMNTTHRTSSDNSN